MRPAIWIYGPVCRPTCGLCWRRYPPSKERRSSFLFNLLHTNIIALSVFFLLLLVGYSYNRTRAGLLAIGVGVLGLLTVIGANIYISLYGWPGA